MTTQPAVLTILLVDDNRDLQSVMRPLLESFGHRVAFADEPMKAIDAALRSQPDVCIIDVVLPGMDGYDLAARLRKIAPHAGIVAMSANPREPDRECECGIYLDHYLNKPFTVDDLLGILETFCGKDTTAMRCDL
ncbi:MAG: hypothetical protein JWP36_852 [Paucimonas sp.]|nr:hypothetical protein [Paucimonas sp.]